MEIHVNVIENEGLNFGFESDICPRQGEKISWRTEEGVDFEAHVKWVTHSLTQGEIVTRHRLVTLDCYLKTTDL